MLRILHAIPGLDARTGGPARAVLELARAQTRTGSLSVALLTTFAPGDLYDAPVALLRDAGVAVRSVGPTSGRFHAHPLTPRAAEACVGQADVVHIHALWEDLQHRTAVACRRAGVPYVWQPHGMLDPWSLSQSPWKKRLVLAWRTRRDLNAAAALAFTTDVERDLVAPLRLRPPAVVESLGVDLSEFDPLPAPELLIARFPALAGRRITLFLGRVHPKKGLDLLLPAFAQAAGGDDVLVIAGPVADGYDAELCRLIAESGLGERVVRTGMLDGAERLAALSAAALFVLPSYQENFGVAVAEAAAAGRPMLISDQVNIWKELKASGAAEVVPARLDAVTAGLRRLLSDDAARARLGFAARAFARQRYDWSHIAQRWVGHYGQLRRGPS